MPRERHADVQQQGADAQQRVQQHEGEECRLDGAAERIGQVQDDDHEPIALVNPEIVKASKDTIVAPEGCLSVPNLRGMVRRFVHLRVQAWDRHGNAIDEVVHGLKAGTYQHEVDHLNGKIFVDRADPGTFTTWTEFERHHRAAFVEKVQALVARVGS